MSFTLLANAKQFVAGPSGEDDPDTLAKVVNAIRQEWYSWYERLPLFRFAEECFEIQTFAENCRETCPLTYRGFTMPNDYTTVEALWIDSRRIEFFNRWRQWQYGMTPPCQCGLQAVEVGRYSTERDLYVGQPSRITFSALDSRDKGKTIEIRGTLATGAPFHGRYTLDVTPQCTPDMLRAFSQVGGIAKDLTIGRVAIAEENGRLLSILNPRDTVPQFLRVKVTGLPDDATCLNVRAARRFSMLYDDGDVVETDNERAWAAMARAQRLDAKPVKNGDDVRSITADKGLAESLLRGDNSRDMGRSVQIDIRVPMPAIGRGIHGLWRNRRGYGR